MEKMIIEGKIEGKRSRGRTPMQWTEQIKTITSYPLEAGRKFQVLERDYCQY